jgi:hypothetical protein
MGGHRVNGPALAPRMEVVMQKQASQPRRRTRVKNATGVYRSITGKYEIAYRDSDGRLRFKTIGDNLEAAKAARAEIVVKLDRGERVAPSRTTFAEWSAEWLSDLRKQARTIDAYRYALDKHLLSPLGKRRVSDIRVDDVARVVAQMEKQGVFVLDDRGRPVHAQRLPADGEAAGAHRR